MSKKLHVFLLTAIFMIAGQFTKGKESACNIKQFKGDFSKQFYKSGSHKVISLENSSSGKILKIRNNGKKYVSGLGILLNGFSGMKSVYLSVSVKTEKLAKPGAVFYYWVDAHGKNLTSARYFVRIDGTHEWQKYEKVISSPMPLKTAGIKIYFAAYREKDGSGYVLFKNPVIRIAAVSDSKVNKKKNAKAALPKSRPKLSSGVFKHGFSAKMPGIAYAVERNGYGWFLMSSSQRLKKGTYYLKVAAPESLDFELYLSNGKRAVLRPVKVKNENNINTFTFGPLKNACWYYWGNVLLFKAGEKTPDKFNISLTFTDGSGQKIFSESVKIKTLNRQSIITGKSSFANRMFYSYPLRRIDYSNPQARLCREILDYLRNKGITSVGYLDFIKKSPFPEKAGEVICHTRFLPYNASYPNIHRLLEKHEIPMAMNLAGIRSDCEIEPQAIVEKGLPFFRELLNNNKNTKYRNSELVWISDYEPYAHEGPVTKYSFAPESIEAFRKFIKASAKLKLTPRMILSKYIKQWVKFRCQQRTELIKTQAKALKEYNPKALFALCSMPLPEAGADNLKYFKRFGVDLRMVDPYVDMHLPMIYARDALFYRRVQSTVKQLKKPVYVVVNCGYDRGIHRPKRLFRLMVGSAFLGTKGVYHWPGLKSMDGEFLQNMQKAMNLIAKIKPFVNESSLQTPPKGIYCPDDKKENFYYALRRKNQNYMFFLVNEGKNKTLYPRITLPADTKLDNVLELVKNQRLELSKHSFNVELPPGSIRIIYTGVKAGLPQIKFSTVNTEAIERKAKAQQEKIKAMHRSGSAHDMSYSFKESVLRVKTPSQTVEFDMDNCALGKWSINGTNKSVEVLSTLGLNFFDYPGNMTIKDIPAELENIQIMPSTLKLEVYYKIKNAPFDGLVIRKTFLLKRDKPEIQVKIKIVPAGGYRQFAFRVNNFTKKTEAVFLINGRKVKTQKRFGSVFNRDGFDYEKFLKSKHIIKAGGFSADNCGLSFPAEKIEVKCSFSKDVKALMNWKGANINTMELIYDKVYKDNDPHKIKEWECNYTLQGFKK